MSEMPTLDRPWLMLGDCLERMREMPDGSVDLTVTSPPYDNLRRYHGYSFDFEGVARELYRLTKQGGVVVWVVGDATVNGSETGTSFRQALHFKNVGFNLHDTMIYAKENYVPLTHNRYEQQFEYMFVLSKGKPSSFNGLRVARATKRTDVGKFYECSGGPRLANTAGTGSTDKLRPNIWTYPVGGSTLSHPAVFPEQLAADHIASWSNPGDFVFDPFLGSGTTGKMALLAGRKFIGIEISDQYLDIARRRIEQAIITANQPAPFGGLFDASEAAE